MLAIINPTEAKQPLHELLCADTNYKCSRSLLTQCIKKIKNKVKELQHTKKKKTAQAKGISITRFKQCRREMHGAHFTHTVAEHVLRHFRDGGGGQDIYKGNIYFSFSAASPVLATEKKLLDSIFVI